MKENTYPKVNYIGNKERICGWIVENLPVKNGIVVDLFSGGCSVSYFLKRKGYRVITNDYLYSNYCIAKALIENKVSTISIEDHIEKAKKNSPWYSQVYEAMNKLYFPNEINELVDILSGIDFSNDYEDFLYLAVLRRAMIRKLPYSRMNVKWEKIQQLRDEVYSYEKYGRKRAYHNLTFLDHMKKNIESYNQAVFDNGKDNVSYNLDALQCILTLKENVDIIYMDPPYPSTMNNYQEFYGAFDKMLGKEDIKGLDFTKREIFMVNFRTLLDAAVFKTDYIVISLNNTCKPSFTDVSKLMREYGSVNILQKDHVYKVTGKTSKMSNYEILLILKVDKGEFYEKEEDRKSKL